MKGTEEHSTVPGKMNKQMVLDKSLAHSHE
jgi:hypothetical protein